MSLVGSEWVPVLVLSLPLQNLHSEDKRMG